VKFKSDRSSKKCRCSLWLAGTLFGKPAAEKEKRNLEDGKSPEQSITIKAALDAFIKDCERETSAETRFENIERLRARSTISEKTMASCYSRFCEPSASFPRTAGKELGPHPRVLLVPASKTTGSPRTRPSLSKHRRQM